MKSESKNIPTFDEYLPDLIRSNKNRHYSASDRILYFISASVFAGATLALTDYMFKGLDNILGEYFSKILEDRELNKDFSLVNQTLKYAKDIVNITLHNSISIGKIYVSYGVAQYSLRTAINQVTKSVTGHEYFRNKKNSWINRPNSLERLVHRLL